MTTKKKTRHGEPELDEKQSAATEAVEGGDSQMVLGDEEDTGFMGKAKSAVHNAAVKAKSALGMGPDDESDVKRPELEGRKKEAVKNPDPGTNNQSRIVHSKDTSDEYNKAANKTEHA